MMPRLLDWPIGGGTAGGGGTPGEVASLMRENSLGFGSGPGVVGGSLPELEGECQPMGQKSLCGQTFLVSRGAR